MKRVLRIGAILVAVVVIAATAVLAYIKYALPDVGEAPNLDIGLTEERIERGRYLATAVSVCMDCHSTRDWTKLSAPILPGTLGMGGEKFDHSIGFPGVFYSRNITPAGIARYTDGELYRLITTGVTKEGRAIFPLMPYRYYAKMADDDIYAIIAYLRTLEPIENAVPASKADFPVSLIMNTLPTAKEPATRPDRTDVLAYGAYVTNAAACKECHTPAEQGQIIEELAFSGGRAFAFPDGSVVRSSNITPDEGTGIGAWTKELFIQRFKIYNDSSMVNSRVNPGDFNTVMPWTMYARMTEEDLGAIYSYLQSLTPMKNAVTKFTAAPEATKTAGH